MIEHDNGPARNIWCNLDDQFKTHVTTHNMPCDVLDCQWLGSVPPMETLYAWRAAAEAVPEYADMLEGARMLLECYRVPHSDDRLTHMDEFAKHDPLSESPLNALAIFVAAADQLLTNWITQHSPDILSHGYPKKLPDFYEFTGELEEWLHVAKTWQDPCNP